MLIHVFIALSSNMFNAHSLSYGRITKITCSGLSFKNTFGLLQSKREAEEAQCVHDSMNRPKFYL